MRRLEVRWGRLHNLGMALAASAMIAFAVVHFVITPAKAPRLSLDDPAFVTLGLLGAALGYYVFLGIDRWRDRRPQVVIDHEGILLGFGRNRRLAWQDIEWVRLRRLGVRPQLEIGLGAETFIAANLGLSMWHLDDALRPVRGRPTSVLVRDNGLDHKTAALLDAVRAFRPNLVRS